MKQNVSILVGDHAGSVGRLLLRRRDVDVRWALSAGELSAVFKSEPPDLCLTHESLAFSAFDALSQSGKRVPVMVLVEPSGWSKREEFFQRGATALVDISDKNRVIQAVSELTGLTFAKYPRIPFRTVVDVSIGDDRYFLESMDLSLSGVSIYDFPTGKFGLEANLVFDLLDPPLQMSSLVVRYLRGSQKSLAGLCFRDVSPEQQERLRNIIESEMQKRNDVPEPMEDFKDSPSQTGDLPMIPEAPEPHMIRAALSGENRPDVPGWLKEACADMTPIERRAAVGEVSTAWARAAVEGRFLISRARSRAGDANLSRSEFDQTFHLCRTLAEAAAHDSDVGTLIQLTEIRASLLRGLYGREPKAD